jgi:hypothetical protein
MSGDYGLDGKQMLFIVLVLMAIGGGVVKGCDFVCNRYTVKVEKKP